ncbi:hypothetical protein JVT61DRAFT_6317 [Boletus reticuloceps]|uniref:MnmG N-terminal domain-containing protein n=1 Tax=Boletus reticuloceps TaxID=495285 RepID=A0A8I2YL29_9AGAM|nr:hypothetical protein JVT61DRAFT_6317 [Boletus reticuloceps]
MPEELQDPMMRTVPGLENVRMVRSAYGVECDHIDPRELQREFIARDQENRSRSQLVRLMHLFTIPPPDRSTVDALGMRLSFVGVDPQTQTPPHGDHPEHARGEWTVKTSDAGDEPNRDDHREVTTTNEEGRGASTKAHGAENAASEARPHSPRLPQPVSGMVE